MTIKELTENTKQYLKYPSLYFRVSKGYLPKALRFSQNNIQKERGYTRTLEDCLESLEKIAKNCNNIVMMYEDFVKHSFYFIMHRKNTAQRDFNGGVILHGYEETFSIELNPPNKPHYSIHT